MQSLNTAERPQGQSLVKGDTCGQKKPLTLVQLISITVYTAILPPEACIFPFISSAFAFFLIPLTFR